MARLLALRTTAPVFAHGKTIDRLVGMLRWHAQKPGLLASALLVYLVLGAAAPGLKMGSLMAQEVDAGAVIIMMDANAMSTVPPTLSAVSGMVSQLQAFIATPNGGLMIALVLAALVMLVVLARGRRNTKSARCAMDPFERLLQRRLVEKAHAESCAANNAGLQRA